MKDSIKKQSLPDLTGINARLYQSLNFYVFRSVKINFLRARTDFWGSKQCISFIVPFDNIIHIRAANTNFSSDSSLAVAVMVKIQYPFQSDKARPLS